MQFLNMCFDANSHVKFEKTNPYLLLEFCLYDSKNGDYYIKQKKLRIVVHWNSCSIEMIFKNTLFVGMILSTITTYDQIICFGD